MRNSITIIFTFLFVSTTLSQVKIVDTPKVGFEERISSAVNEIRIIDTHEHITSEEDRLKSRDTIDFTYLFRHYAKNDLISAIGNPDKELIDLIYQSNLPLLDRWKFLKPFYKAIRGTGYGRVPLIAARDLYGVSEINELTIEELTSKMRAANKPGLYSWVLKDKAKIDLSIQDLGHHKFDQKFYRHVERFSQIFISSGAQIRDNGAQFDTQINNMSDYLKLLRDRFVAGVESGMIGVKVGVAYQRILKFDNISEERAEKIFTALLNNSEVNPEDIKAVQDYLMHRLLDLVDEFDLPIQIHTGLQAGNGNIITNSNPTHLTNLFFEYPNIDFILFHGSYPYGGELATLAKNFPNVYLDMCWLYIISPSYSERYLNEWIETVPANKIMGFGGDYNFVEGVYAHSIMARQIISKVLIDKVRSRYLTEDEAIDIAKMILRKNALRVFKLEGDTNSYDNMEILKKPGPIHDWLELHNTKTGFINNWKVIGIFDFGSGLNHVCPPEKELILDKSYQGKGGEVKWKAENTSKSGYLDLISIFNKRTNEVSPRAKGIAYAYTEIESPDNREVKMTVGSNDGAKIWLNNKIVYNYDSARGALANQDIISVKLRKGINKILVKIVNFGEGWGLYLRVLDPEKVLKITQFQN